VRCGERCVKELDGQTAVTTTCKLKVIQLPTNSEATSPYFQIYNHGFQSFAPSELIMEHLRRNETENSVQDFKEVTISLSRESKMAFSRGEAIALWVGVILFCSMLFCIFYRLCKVTVRTLIENLRPAEKKKKLNSQEKKVNKILSNQNAREILKSRAITAINSQASRSRRGFSSQLSLSSTGTVPDLTDRVIRVSFAPCGSQETGDCAGGSAPESPSSLGPPSLPGTPSIPGTPSPPDYDTLSTHSRVSASDPPPDYAAAVPQ